MGTCMHAIVESPTDGHIGKVTHAELIAIPWPYPRTANRWPLAWHGNVLYIEHLFPWM